MKKIVLSLIFTLFIFVSAFAQFDPQYSQYMLNPTAFNPAAAAESGMIDITGQHRIQWIGMPNGGQTTNFSIVAPLKINKSLHGLGLSFLNDKAGQFVNQAVHLKYAYKIPLGEGKLSLGADIGFVSLGFNGDSVLNHMVSIGDYYDFTSDPEIPTTSVVGNGFDVNLGAWYSTPDFYTGVSMTHVNQPVIEWGDRTEYRPASTLFGTAGYKFSLPGTKYILKPSTLIKTDFKTMQVDLTGKLEYDNKYWGGLSYRWEDAVVFFAGINITGGLSIGYSYDLPASQILNVSWGSHEICMIYSFEYVPQKTTTKYKSIRIL